MPPASTAHAINTSCTGEFIWLNMKARLLSLFYFPIWDSHKWLINFNETLEGFGFKYFLMAVPPFCSSTQGTGGISGWGKKVYRASNSNCVPMETGARYSEADEVCPLSTLEVLFTFSRRALRLRESSNMLPFQSRCYNFSVDSVPSGTTSSGTQCSTKAFVQVSDLSYKSQYVNKSYRPLWSMTGCSIIMPFPPLKSCFQFQRDSKDYVTLAES